MEELKDKLLAQELEDLEFEDDNLEAIIQYCYNDILSYVHNYELSHTVKIKVDNLLDTLHELSIELTNES